MTEFVAMRLDWQRCCAADPIVVLKVHRLSEPLLGGLACDLCEDHLPEGVKQAVRLMHNDNDVHGFSVMLP